MKAVPALLALTIVLVACVLWLAWDPGPRPVLGLGRASSEDAERRAETARAEEPEPLRAEEVAPRLAPREDTADVEDLPEQVRVLLGRTGEGVAHWREYEQVMARNMRVQQDSAALAVLTRIGVPESPEADARRLYEGYVEPALGGREVSAQQVADARATLATFYDDIRAASRVASDWYGSGSLSGESFRVRAHNAERRMQMLLDLDPKIVRYVTDAEARLEIILGPAQDGSRYLWELHQGRVSER